MASQQAYARRDAAHLSDSEVLAEAHQIVDLFLEFARRERIERDILDIRTLPTSKASLESAFRLVIAIERDKWLRRKLVAEGLMLARFQPGIGDRISLVPAYRSQQRATDEPCARDLHRFDAALVNMARDTRRLEQIFNEAATIAERRFGAFDAPAPFREDGTYTWYGHH